MARITDQKKIERLKQSTIKLVVEKGYGGASAVLIAKDAKIATGYFYLHYNNKYQMVNALLHDIYHEIINPFEELIQNNSSFIHIVHKLINHIFVMATKEPTKIKFLNALMNDYSFVLDHKIRENTFEYISKLKDIGHTSGVLDKQVKEDDIYLILFLNSIQFINQRLKNTSGKTKFTKEDEDHLLYLINKTLK